MEAYKDILTKNKKNNFGSIKAYVYLTVRKTLLAGVIYNYLKIIIFKPVLMTR